MHDGHDQRRRHAFAGDVGKGNGDVMVTDLKEIVVVAADRPGGQTDRRQRGDGGLGRVIGQQAPLDFAGQGQIAPQSSPARPLARSAAHFRS